MGAGYWEVGASGTRYDRAAILDVLRQRAAQPADDPWEVLDFACWQLAEKTYLATYLLHQGPRVTRRATVWQQTESGWKALYHQGTIVGG